MAINTTTYDRTPGGHAPDDVPNKGLYYGIGVAVLLLLIIVFAVRNNRISPATSSTGTETSTNVERSQINDTGATAPMESTTAPINTGSEITGRAAGPGSSTTNNSGTTSYQGSDRTGTTTQEGTQPGTGTGTTTTPPGQ